MVGEYDTHSLIISNEQNPYITNITPKHEISHTPLHVLKMCCSKDVVTHVELWDICYIKVFIQLWENSSKQILAAFILNITNLVLKNAWTIKNCSFRPLRIVIMRLHWTTKQAYVKKLFYTCSIMSAESTFNLKLSCKQF